jgi:hypothetical protein
MAPTGASSILLEQGALPNLADLTTAGKNQFL